MKLLLTIFICLAIAVPAVPADKSYNNLPCGVKKNDDVGLRIFNGEEAKKHSIPWQVWVVNDVDSPIYCGGTIIGPYQIITAAHCFNVNLNTAYIYVRLEEHDLNDKHDGVTRRVSCLIRHPKYDSSTWNNDFAILFLEEIIHFNEKNAPAYLPRVSNNDLDAYVGKKLTISGWGLQNWFDDDFSAKLHYGHVYGISNKACQNELNSYIFSSRRITVTESMLCATDPKMNVMSCSGDDGGPVTYDDGHKVVLVGVNSYSPNCISGVNLQVHARISTVIDWIETAGQIHAYKKPKCPSDTHMFIK